MNFTCVPLPLPGGPNKTALIPFFGTSFGNSKISFGTVSTRGAIFCYQSQLIKFKKNKIYETDYVKFTIKST